MLFLLKFLTYPLAWLVLFRAHTIIRSENIEIDVDNSSGDFSIFVDRKLFFRGGKEVFFHANSKKFSLADKTLRLVEVSRDEGEGELGAFTESIISYEAQGLQGTRMRCSIKLFSESNSIVFEQSFDRAIHGASTGFADGLTTAFPSFDLSASAQKLGYAQWISWYYGSVDRDMSPEEQGRRKALVAPGFSSPEYGLWDGSAQLSGGIGGSGVVCVFDEEARLSFVLSPLDNFMVQSHVSSSPGALSYGLAGNITAIPPGLKSRTMLHVGSSGMTAAVRSWGRVMRGLYGKPSASGAREKDVTLQYAGYTTDNGAYYYYNTMPGGNYEDTVVAIKKYADDIELPIKYILLDSWWYFKGSNGGVSDWAARPDVFPGGLQALHQKTGLLVQAHNRYWAADAVYAKQNGGAYEWLIDYVKNGSVPLDQAFWDHLFAGSSSWGLRVYEQDWLYNEFYVYVGEFLRDVSLGREWLLQMARGAERSGLTIQYCMPHVRHLLQSLEFPAVTQVRASDDYVVSPYDGEDNWRIGGNTLLIDALGMAPSKDSFWSSRSQPGNPYGDDRYEPYSLLQATVTALSAGPYALADGISFVDRALVMRGLRADGRLLQACVPATRIDLTWTSAALGLRNGLAGEVWFSHTSLGEAALFGNLFVADVASDYGPGLRPRDLDRLLLGGEGREFWALEHSHGLAAAARPVRLSDRKPLAVASCGLQDFRLYAIAEVHRGATYSLLGEVGSKFVAVATARFSQLAEGASGELTVRAAGAAGEQIQVLFVHNGSGDLESVYCTFDDRGSLLVSSTGTCL